MGKKLYDIVEEEKKVFKDLIKTIHKFIKCQDFAQHQGLSKSKIKKGFLIALFKEMVEYSVLMLFLNPMQTPLRAIVMANIMKK